MKGANQLRWSQSNFAEALRQGTAVLSDWGCCCVALGKSFKLCWHQFPFFKKRCQECFEQMY